MPSCCGLFSKRHPSEEQDEKAVPVSNPSSTSATAPKPKKATTSSNFTEIDWTPVETGLTLKDEGKPDIPTTINGDSTELAKVERIPTNDDKNAPMADQLKGAASGVTNTVSSGASGVTNTVSSGAQQASEGAQSAASSAQNATTAGESWNAMTEEQKQETYNALPEKQKQGQSYYEWVKQGLYNQSENWMPWVEDQYLKWFTNDNKASYATKGTQFPILFDSADRCANLL